MFFLIGLYWGLEKPLDSNSYLVNELKELSTIGMSTPYGRKFVVINCIFCDVPARSILVCGPIHLFINYGYY